MPKARWVRGIVLGSALLVLAGAPGVADQFWVAYEGDDYPENVGWNRNYGDETGGPPHGGAHRSIADGVLTLDSLFNDQVYDYYEMIPSTMPGPAEAFVAEWRVLVDSRSGTIDTGVLIARDDPPGHVEFYLGGDGLHVNFDEAFVSLAPDTFHTFRFASADMTSYELTIDESMTYAGTLKASLLTRRVSFGDGVMGQASLSHWDYMRFGIVPEPRSFAAALLAAAIVGRRWFQPRGWRTECDEGGRSCFTAASRRRQSPAG